MAKQKTPTPAEGFEAALAAYTKKIGDDLGRANGAMSHMARALGASRQNTSYWRKHGVPIAWLGRVEKLTGVSRRILRPDIYD